MACKDCRYGGVCWKQHELLSTLEETEMLDCFEDSRDFPHVVRCKDCKNLCKLENYNWLAGECGITKNKVTADFFCAFGERKDGGGSADNHD